MSQILAEARATIESRFLVGPVGNHSRAATGEPYVEIVSGGVKEEGQRLPALCISPEVAVRLWKEAVEAYAAGKSGTLYWRIVPELNDGMVCTEVNEKGNYDGDRRDLPIYLRKVYFVYSRLLISDQPEIAPAVIYRFGQTK